MIKVLVIDDSALVRKLLGRVLADVADFEVHFARNGLEGLEQLAADQSRRRHARHSHAGDGRPRLPRPDHDRASLPCGDGVFADARGRGSDARGVASGRGRFRAEARRRAFPCTWTCSAPLFVAKVRAAAGAKLKASLRLRERVRHRIGASASARRRARRRGRGARARRPETESWWSEPRPAGLRRWRRCSARCRRLFRGPSSSPSTCRRISPARSPAASTASARSA